MDRNVCNKSNPNILADKNVSGNVSGKDVTWKFSKFSVLISVASLCLAIMMTRNYNCKDRKLGSYFVQRGVFMG